MGVKNMGKFSVFLIIVMCCWAYMAEAAYFKYKDPKQKLGVRIKDLMKRMTVEEKIGQMTQIDRTVASNEVMKKYLIGTRIIPTLLFCVRDVSYTCFRFQGVF